MFSNTQIVMTQYIVASLSLSVITNQSTTNLPKLTKVSNIPTSW